MQYQTPKGTFDVLPDEVHKWQRVEAVARQVAECFGYREIRTPIFEHTELFSRGVGESTDIVEKEMYTFTDRGNRLLTLRPELTAPVARAYVEHNLGSQSPLLKVYYLGAIFRYERPQAGRFRQSHQFGAEALGSLSPLLDAELISLVMEFYQELGLENLKVELNSIGCPDCRLSYKELLVKYLEQNRENLCPDCRRRIAANPLRVFDCKKPACGELIKKAPKILDHICPACREHFSKVKENLTALKLPYQENPLIVRGLDYYTRTVFELFSQHLGAQNALCGGGRYDRLVEILGGKPTPAVGFAGGIERAILVREKQKGELPSPFKLDILLFAMGEKEKELAAGLAFNLRKAKVKTDLEECKSFKSAIKTALAKAARFLGILGEDELKNRELSIKDLQTEKQIKLPLSRFNQLTGNYQAQELLNELLKSFEV